MTPTTPDIIKISENVKIREDYNGSTYSTDAEGEPDDEHAPTPSGVLVSGLYRVLGLCQC
jgi:hypothetical protein